MYSRAPGPHRFENVLRHRFGVQNEDGGLRRRQFQAPRKFVERNLHKTAFEQQHVDPEPLDAVQKLIGVLEPAGR